MRFQVPPAELTAAKYRHKGGGYNRLLSVWGRIGMFCAALAVGFFADWTAGCTGLFTAKTHLAGRSCTWVTPAAAELTEAEKQALEQQKKLEEQQREAEKKALELQREAEKKALEQQSEAEKQALEQQKKASEQQREQEKKALESQYKQAKKALEQSGGSEEEKKALEKGYKKKKKKLEGRYERYVNEVPDTVAGVLEKIFSPRSSKKKSGKKKADKKKDDKGYKKEDNKKAKKNARSRSKSKVRRSSQSSRPNKGFRSSFKRGEVLAFNLSKKGRGKAKKFGFKIISSSDISSLNGKVVRLRIPRGMDTRTARQFLKRAAPSDNFELNKLYRVYRAAKGFKATKPAKAVERGPLRIHQRSGRKARSAKHACEADHCFARSVMHWKKELASCSKGVRIGIVDTTIDFTHPTFSGQDIKVGSFLTAGRKASSDNHGTAIASMLAGSRKSGTPGLIPDAEFFTANIFYLDDDDYAAADTVSLLKALDWMEAWDVQLVNMSFTGPEDKLIHEALQRMTRKNVIFVAAAGNEGPAAPPRYPAAYPEVIAVTAIDKKLRNYRRANRGSHVDVSAPGVDIWTALPGNREGYQSGTSFAAPHVTALLATIYESRRRSAKTVDHLIRHLPVQDLGSRGRDPVYGEGLVMAPVDCRGTNSLPTVVAQQRGIRSGGKKGGSLSTFGPAGLSWKPLSHGDALSLDRIFSLTKRP